MDSFSYFRHVCFRRCDHHTRFCGDVSMRHMSIFIHSFIHKYVSRDFSPLIVGGSGHQGNVWFSLGFFFSVGFGGLTTRTTKVCFSLRVFSVGLGAILPARPGGLGKVVRSWLARTRKSPRTRTTVIPMMRLLLKFRFRQMPRHLRDTVMTLLVFFAISSCPFPPVNDAGERVSNY